MKPRALVQTLIICLITIWFSSSALAHKVRIFAWQEGDTIFTESKFSGGKPAKNVAIFAINPATQQRLYSGNTDENGNFSFLIDGTQPETLEIVVDGGDGHRNSWTHTLESSTPNRVELEKKAPPQTGQIPVSEPSLEQEQTISIEQLTTVLEKVIDQKLGPIKKTLAESSDKGPSLQDILGGIGYIFGLAGIAAYMKSRKQ